MEQQQIYAISHLLNQNLGILKKVYRISPVGTSPNEYLIRFRSMDKSNYHLHIKIGQFIKYVDETELDDLMKNALSGKSRDGYGEAILKYFEDKYLDRVLPMKNDRSILFCFTNGNKLRFDLFGTGQSRICSGDRTVYWNPVAKLVESEERQLSLENLYLYRQSEITAPKQLHKPSAKPKEKKRNKLSREDYVLLQASNHLTQATKLFDEAEKKINSSIETSTEIDWKETSKIFSAYKEKKSKGEKAKEHLVTPIICKEKSKKLELKFVKPTSSEYHFAYTTNGFLVLGSKNSNQVDNMVRSYGQPNNLYFHIDEHGGSSVFLINGANASPKDIEDTANLTVTWSSSTNSVVEVPVFYVPTEQISNSAPSGMFLNTGSVMILGKKNMLSKRIPTPCYYLRETSSLVQLIYGCQETSQNKYYKLNCTNHSNPHKKMTNDLKNLLTTESFSEYKKLYA